MSIDLDDVPIRLYSPWEDYPTEIELQYNTDEEYQVCIRRLIHPSVLCPTPALPDFCDVAFSRFSSEIHKHTYDIPLFKELYITAAREILSEDTELGMVILMAYDNLPHFHDCLCALFSNKSVETSAGYIELTRKFSLSS